MGGAGNAEVTGTTCTQCTSQNNSANEPYYLNPETGTCSTTCPEGTWKGEHETAVGVKVCKDCPTECTSCTDMNTCTNCKPGYDLDTTTNSCT